MHCLDSRPPDHKPSGTRSCQCNRPHWCPASWRRSPLGHSRPPRASSSLRGSRAAGRPRRCYSRHRELIKRILHLSSHDLFFSWSSSYCWWFSWRWMCLSGPVAWSPGRTLWSHSSWPARCGRGAPRPAGWARPDQLSEWEALILECDRDLIKSIDFSHLWHTYLPGVVFIIFLPSGQVRTVSNSPICLLGRSLPAW